MIGMKTNFMHTFDKSILQKNWKRVNRSPIQQAGIFVRRTMRDLIRPDRTKAQNPAKPGRPPKARRHKGSYPFRMIFSEPDIHDTSVAIGHYGFRPGANQTVMSVHEFGESKVITVPVKQRRGRSYVLSPAQKANARRKFLNGTIRHNRIGAQGNNPRIQMRVRYPKREFANPALEKNLDKIPTLWRGSFNDVTVAGVKGGARF